MTQHKITALKIQKRNHQRVNVYLDGEFAFGLARIVAAWLEVGQEIDDEKVEALQAEDAHEAAYQRALHFLSYRQRTEAEIRQHLEKNEIPPATIEYVLDRLRRSRLVDDARFAEAWVENRSEFRPRGRRALAYELRRRGISNPVIDEALEEIDEDELAYQAAEKQYRKYRNFEWPYFRKKMYAFLSRRGFNYEASANATSRIWSEKNGSDSDHNNSLANQEVDL